MRSNFLLFIIGSVLFVACKCHKPAANAAPSEGKAASVAAVDSNMRLVVSFYSIGSGVEGTEVEKFQVYIVEFGTKVGKEINYSRKPWGREGEVDFCFPLKELTADQQKDFIAGGKEYVKSAKWVHFKENVPCKK